MEIVKTTDNNLAIREMAEDLRTKKVIELGVWLSRLLSLKDDTSMERLEVLLPMVSEFCWSMDIPEIKKAFVKYVKGELSGLEPRTNFLDVILFGKVVKAYKAQKIEKPIDIEQKKRDPLQERENEIKNILLAYDEFEERGYVPLDYFTAFDALYEMSILPKSGFSEKSDAKYEAMLKKAHLKLVAPLIDQRLSMQKKNETKSDRYKKLVKKINELNQSYSHPKIMSVFKCDVLSGFFSKISKEELDKKIKEI